jgi:hypothetical protein
MSLIKPFFLLINPAVYVVLLVLVVKTVLVCLFVVTQVPSELEQLALEAVVLAFVSVELRLFLFQTATYP